MPVSRWSARRRLLPVIALGGMCGAGARYALELAWPPAGQPLPWTTLVTNASGCLAIGLLMVYVVEAGGAHPLVRPFVGVGVLGGYTTFSTYAVQSTLLLDGGEPVRALAYLLGTVPAALLSVALGVALARSGRTLARRAARRTGPRTGPRTGREPR